MGGRKETWSGCGGWGDAFFMKLLLFCRPKVKHQRTNHTKKMYPGCLSNSFMPCLIENAVKELGEP
jgi:hypothetical protein